MTSSWVGECAVSVGFRYASVFRMVIARSTARAKSAALPDAAAWSMAAAHAFSVVCTVPCRCSAFARAKTAKDRSRARRCARLACDESSRARSDSRRVAFKLATAVGASTDKPIARTDPAVSALPIEPGAHDKNARPATSHSTNTSQNVGVAAAAGIHRIP